VLNISIAIAYSYLAIVLSHYARITLINTTPNTITDIQMVGCEDKIINKLEKEDNKTLWMRISEDCAIDITYISKGTQNKDNIIEYISPGMGIKQEYRIE
jgi:hypothetical protein